VLDMGTKEPGTTVECCLTPGFNQGCSDVAYFDVSLDGSSWTAMDSFPTSSTQKPGGGWEPFCTTVTPDQAYRYIRGGNNKCYVDHLACYVQCGDGEEEIDESAATEILPAAGDTWLENSGNQGSHKYLIVGLHGTWPKKRSLIKFDLSGLDSTKTIQSATMWVYYRYAHQASFLQEAGIDRVIAVHQVLVPWEENTASSSKATAISLWSESFCGINDVDAASMPEDSQLWLVAETKEWKSFDITALAQKWGDDPDTNFGVLLRAENESLKGRDMRMYSRNASETDDDGNKFHPYLEVTYNP